VGKVEIIARIERRRKWTAEEKAALLAEVEAEGGKVAVVARRHRISDSLLYNWRSAWKAAAAARRVPERTEFVPIGVIGRVDDEGAAMLAPPSPQPVQLPKKHTCLEDRAGAIEIVLPSGVCLRVDADVNEKALRRVLHAMKGAV
jgi:transposase